MDNINVPKVKDILQKKVIAFRPDYTSFDIVSSFNKLRISSAPVVNDNNEVVGFISESDLLKCLGNCLFFNDQRIIKVAYIMSQDVKFAKCEWDIFELDNFLVKNRIQAAPVVDEENHLVGIVTRRDALNSLEDIMNKREDYKKQIKEPVELSMHHRMRIILANR